MTRKNQRELVDCNINLAFKSGEPFDSAQGDGQRNSVRGELVEPCTVDAKQVLQSTSAENLRKPQNSRKPRKTIKHSNL